MEIKTSSIITEKHDDLISGFLNQYNQDRSVSFEGEVNEDLEIIMYDQHEIIGGIIGRSLWGTLEIKRLAVHPDYRHKGIGSKLIAAAEEEAKKRQCGYLSLNTFSYQAPEFYEKMGFKKIGTEKDFPRGFERYFYQKKID
ncbi:GNAT family N-acetyltransferase [Elizabethkingia meningoseptica]|uniref:GNAT family N-acetyltransferase n=1 Tax=Elizabethkingia meningoseptica TaxID=238 RepID=UPI0023AF03B8|nr:GNAT family N-acetyltransferase [Elizabethkingia meningoseptica]MDE5437128.1 GNAT family N-acetyltransferase [Elizabethkingia meningoseptica]MDE5509741.1 GNAT family N-acetyltransferase [Elizabethkingia meningoseptica]MDE5514362.1 GNAT family N-acetyltransferase [Elizabethkingia meningoseptica]MDE5525009.1 GNAT family N-acetyltransferase [Elizabethkingia meningoseptica]MDE5528573.1 GNAT family N-acetyltransferase [Elizabethkingia meningoseptica]